MLLDYADNDNQMNVIDKKKSAKCISVIQSYKLSTQNVPVCCKM